MTFLPYGGITVQIHAYGHYYSGLKGNIARLTLADANEPRDWIIYNTSNTNGAGGYGYLGQFVLKNGMIIYTECASRCANIYL